MTEERTVDVPVHLVGEAAGAKEGGVVEQPLFDLQVTATPENIPESIEVDITELEVNDSYSVSDIKVSGDFTIENDPEESVVTVVPPTDEPTEEEVEAMEGEAVTEEPEVVGEEKKKIAKKKIKTKNNSLIVIFMGVEHEFLMNSVLLPLCYYRECYKIMNN